MSSKKFKSRRGMSRQNVSKVDHDADRKIGKNETKSEKKETKIEKNESSTHVKVDIDNQHVKKDTSVIFSTSFLLSSLYTVLLSSFLYSELSGETIRELKDLMEGGDVNTTITTTILFIRRYKLKYGIMLYGVI